MGAILRAKDIADIMDFSLSSGYAVIKKLNKELEKKGYMTFEGRVSAVYFFERYNLPLPEATVKGVVMTAK